MSMDNNLISRRTFFTSSNNVCHKSGVYDDAFGAAHPRLPLPNLAPRLEDYSEIFVDASRSFSIPVLDLPLLTGADDSNHFDYAEIFGGVDFDSSSSDDNEEEDEPWSPAQSGSLSDDFDPLARSDDSLRSSDAADAHHSLETTKQFNASYNNNSSQSNIGTVLVGSTVHVTNFSAFSNPGYALSDYNESPVSCDGEDENCSVSAVDVPSLDASKEHGKRVALEKQHTKCSGNPAQRNEFINLSENHEIFTCKPFMTVSDISLRTKPSRLPPPSRPPPTLSAKKGDSDTSELEASKSYAFERLADDSSSLFSEVEVVSATLSPEGTGNGNKGVDNYDETVAWGEGNEYFEVIENNISKQAFDVIMDGDILSRHMNSDAYKHRRDTGSASDTGKKVKVLKEAQGLEKQRRQPEVTNEQKEIPNTRLSDQTSFQEKVIRSKLTSQCSLNKMGTEDFQQFRERERLPTDNCETVEVLPQGEGDLIEVDARSELWESNKGVAIGKKSVDAQMTRQNSEKHNQNIPREEFQLENVEVAENRDQPLPCEVEKDNEKLFEGGIQVKNELMHKDSLQQIRNEKDHKLSHEREVTEEINRDAPIVENNGLRFRRVDTDPGHTPGFFKTKGHINLSRPAGVQKEPNEDATETEPVESNEHEKEVEVTATTVSRKQYSEENGQLKVDLNNINHEGEPIDFSKQKNEGIAVNITSRGPPTQDTPQFISKTVDVKDSFIPCQVIRESSLVNGMKEKHIDGILYSIKNATSQKIERKNYNNFKDNLAAKDQKAGERIRREIELENEHIRKIEEKEREREREKDRMAVDKAALEACERSYTDARERAAVSRVTAEVRQRAMAEARERLENSSMDTKLRTDRAAIERATSEARQRAAEKSVSQNAASEVHFRVERSASLKYSFTRQCSLSSDTQLKSTGSSSNLQYSYSFGHAGADSESPQRCKARLERYQRTAERAANALAEKNMRDLLVQREREEMNRVAETLDSEIKRWSGGKEANLRALLSTLQYILGPDSGWQPVPLTEVITSAAVKRAYRKATLCVHPDKLQQRGATIQQKYICEKVFDLLKEAWNKFNSEEM